MSYERPGHVAGLYLSWYRSGIDGRDHAVTDERFLDGMRAGRGQYEAVCGHLVDITSVMQPPGVPCARCHAFLAARATLQDAAERMAICRPRKVGIWRRLLGRSRAPAVVGRTSVPAGAGMTPTAPAPAGRHSLRGER